MKQIILHRLRAPKKVLLHFPHPQLQLKILLFMNRYQYGFKLWYVFLWKDHREGVPIQNFKERRHIVVCYKHRNTLVEDGLNNARAITFVTPWADAVLTGLHMLNVIHLAHVYGRHGAKDFHIRVFVLPML